MTGKFADYVWALTALLIVLSPNLFMMFHPANVGSLFGVLRLSLVVLSSVFLVLLPVLVLPIRVRRYLFFLLPFALLAPLEIMYVKDYGVNLAFGTITALYNTSFSESLEYLSRNLPYVIAMPLAAVAYFYLVLRRTPESALPRVFRISILAGMVVILGVTSARQAWVIRNRAPTDTIPARVAKKLVAELVQKTYPVGTLLNLYSAYRFRAEMLARERRLIDFSFGARLREVDDDREIVVLIIGESERYESWGINGYERDTSPRIEKIDGLLSFADVCSPATLTSPSVPIMLTRATASDLTAIQEEKSVVSAFREAGFGTHWISNQATFSGLIQTLANEADQTTYLNQDTRAEGFYDAMMLPHLDRVLKEGEQRTFVVLHILGSHFAYSLRYPEEFAKFQPTLSGYRTAEGQNPGNATEFRNAYDNSILYTDFIIAEVIERVKAAGGVSAVVFVSDHGQNLYDDARQKIMHGTVDPSRVEVHIPLFLWLSPEYVQRHPDRAAGAAANRGKRIAAEGLFHWLLDLADIGYAGEDATLSILSDRYLERRRLVQTVDRKLVECETLE